MLRELLWCYNEKIKMSLKLIKSSNWWWKTDVKIIKMVLEFYLEISLNKSMHIKSTHQLISVCIQWTGFYMIQAFTEGFFSIRL